MLFDKGLQSQENIGSVGDIMYASIMIWTQRDNVFQLASESAW
ncbi:hypothetical protein ACTJLC_30415 [Paraburkholderia sp. 22099]|jgi:hypothetical protein|nr:hypothetical protein [Paraburkholderia terricola]MDR6449970.1 hypothetical protein [Paraburkholderia terricola]MDR6496567.1 hypothetical protein [Paraburkholderia terricola]